MKTARTYEKLKSRLDELSGNTVEKQTNNTAEAKKKAEAYNIAFWETMHTGMPQNTLKEGSDGSGGYLVPDTYDDRLVQALKQKNVLRQIATVIPTTQKLTIPVSLGGENASWMPENEPYTFCEAEFGEIEIDAYKLGSSILVSDELLEDGGVDLKNISKKPLCTESAMLRNLPLSEETETESLSVLFTRLLLVRSRMRKAKSVQMTWSIWSFLWQSLIAKMRCGLCPTMHIADSDSCAIIVAILFGVTDLKRKCL